MKRHYFISDDLEDLEAIEHELETQGISTPQIHVLSEDDVEVNKHQLHTVDSLSKQDVIHSGIVGAVIGLVIAVVILISAYFVGASDAVSWLPFVFLAFIAFGFCTWEGGLFGIQVMNAEFRRFRDVLSLGKHVLFVDLKDKQLPLLQQMMIRHPKLQEAGTGQGAPDWIVSSNEKWRRFIKAMP